MANYSGERLLVFDSTSAGSSHLHICPFAVPSQRKQPKAHGSLHTAKAPQLHRQREVSTNLKHLQISVHRVMRHDKLCYDASTASQHLDVLVSPGALARSNCSLCVTVVACLRVLRTFNLSPSLVLSHTNGRCDSGYHCLVLRRQLLQVTDQ